MNTAAVNAKFDLESLISAVCVCVCAEQTIICDPYSYKKYYKSSLPHVTQSYISLPSGTICHCFRTISSCTICMFTGSYP